MTQLLIALAMIAVSEIQRYAGKVVEVISPGTPFLAADQEEFEYLLKCGAATSDSDVIEGTLAGDDTNETGAEELSLEQLRAQLTERQLAYPPKAKVAALKAILAEADALILADAEAARLLAEKTANESLV